MRLRFLKIVLIKLPVFLLILIYFITEVARYAEKDANIKASKHLATAEDKNINTKLAGNTVLVDNT